MQVLIVGNSGSDKSTYAKALSERQGLTHLDLDIIVWKVGKIGVQRPIDAIQASLQQFILRICCTVHRGML